jgi:hypothetical protein
MKPRTNTFHSSHSLVRSIQSNKKILFKRHSDNKIFPTVQLFTRGYDIYEAGFDHDKTRAILFEQLNHTSEFPIVAKALAHCKRQEYETAKKLFLQASLEKNPEATYKLGLLYLLGVLPQPQDKQAQISLAAKYFRDAYDQGMKGNARIMLELMFEQSKLSGNPNPYNNPDVVYHFNRVLGEGMTFSQFSLRKDYKDEINHLKLRYDVSKEKKHNISDRTLFPRHALKILAKKKPEKIRSYLADYPQDIDNIARWLDSDIIDRLGLSRVQQEQINQKRRAKEAWLNQPQTNEIKLPSNGVTIDSDTLHQLVDYHNTRKANPNIIGDFVHNKKLLKLDKKSAYSVEDTQYVVQIAHQKNLVFMNLWNGEIDQLYRRRERLRSQLDKLADKLPRSKYDMDYGVNMTLGTMIGTGAGGLSALTIATPLALTVLGMLGPIGATIVIAALVIMPVVIGAMIGLNKTRRARQAQQQLNALKTEINQLDTAITAKRETLTQQPLSIPVIETQPSSHPAPPTPVIKSRLDASALAPPASVEINPGHPAATVELTSVVTPACNVSIPVAEARPSFHPAAPAVESRPDGLAFFPSAPPAPVAINSDPIATVELIRIPPRPSSVNTI